MTSNNKNFINTNALYNIINQTNIKYHNDSINLFDAIYPIQKKLSLYIKSTFYIEHVHKFIQDRKSY